MILILVRILIFFGLGFLFYRFIKKGIKKVVSSEYPQRELDANELVRCEQCGNFIDRTVIIERKKKLFCSQVCSDLYFGSK